jgi:hypothetical protein
LEKRSLGADPNERSPENTKKKEVPKSQKGWSIQKHTGLEEEKAQESSKTQKK